MYIITLFSVVIIQCEYFTLFLSIYYQMQFVSFRLHTNNWVLGFINNGAFAGSFCHCFVFIYWIVWSFLFLCYSLVSTLILLCDFIRAHNIDFWLTKKSTMCCLLVFWKCFGYNHCFRYNLIVCGADLMQTNGKANYWEEWT